MGLDQELADALAQYLPVSGTASLHGGLIGCMCAAYPPAQDWLRRLALALSLPEEQVASLATEMAEAAEAGVSSLADPELGFTMALPHEDQPLKQRAEALSQWCDAFLLAYSAATTDRSESGDAAELLNDLSQVRDALEGTFEDSSDADEDDFEHVLEFVRVAAISLFLEHAEREQSDEDSAGQMMH